jgi:hypothetical protein
MAIQKEGMGEYEYFQIKGQAVPLNTFHHSLLIVNNLDTMLFNNWYCSCQAIHVQENSGNLQEIFLSFI